MVIQTAQATQLDGKEWVVTDSNGEGNLFEFDSSMTAQQVMSAIHMARKFERLAYAEGLDDQLTICNKQLSRVMKQGQAQVDELNNRIEGLGSELNRLMELEEV